MCEIASDFNHIAIVGFGAAGHVPASSWLPPMRGTTRAYDLKLCSVIIKKLGARTTQCLLAVQRAVEVEEVCTTLPAFGLPDWMSRGTIEWQRLVSSLDVTPGEDDLAQRSDAILGKL